MKINIMTVLSIGILLFSGCGEPQPSFNANNKGVVFVEGKPYLIPARTYHYGPIRHQSAIKENKKFGMTCRMGDILYMSQELKNRGKGASTSQRDALTYQGVQYGHIGCASPLSNQQYQYVLQQQQINANRAATNAQINANRAATNAQTMAAITAQNNASSARMNAQSNAMLNNMVSESRRDKTMIIGKMPGGGYYVR